MGKRAYVIIVDD
ncbi:hypothetical protein COV94_05215 [Candidatus Woesearchaeota archaeon CG11_big_fil_rev_8_21_14_0_20_57_5]|nr:MAG: hypothetical protein COV94_05215 [Candidatus Woesearchaeota archaeon CG11_big_fil_rev_8_21_14_0_20_57_5]